MRVPTLILASLVATTGAGTANAVSLSYAFSTCDSYTCTNAIDTILSFTVDTVILAPADPGPAPDPSDPNNSGYVPLSGLSVTAGSFVSAAIDTYNFQSRIGSLLQFSGLVPANGSTAYSVGGLATKIGSVKASPNDLPLVIGVGSYNGLGIFTCLDAGCSSTSTSIVPVLLTVSEAPTGAVPEPTTWAMMVGGFGLIGTAMRRRRIRVRFA